MSHKKAGFVEDQTKCQNHDKLKVAKLLKVPWYADLWEEDGEAGNNERNVVAQQGLVKS
jgi:hypothetical protein